MVWRAKVPSGCEPAPERWRAPNSMEVLRKALVLELVGASLGSQKGPSRAFEVAKRTAVSKNTRIIIYYALICVHMFLFF